MASAVTTFSVSRSARVNSLDPALVERCKQGDLTAYGELVDRYKGPVHSFVARSVRNRADAEDLTQDVFVQAFAAMGRYRSEASFKTWLFRIAHNRVIDHSRRQRKRAEVVAAYPLPLDDEESSPTENLAGPAIDNPIQELCRDELTERVHLAVAALSDKLRTVVVLYDFEGCSYEEIAKIVHCPIGTVKSRLYNARMALKTRLGSYMSDRLPGDGAERSGLGSDGR